MKQFNNRQAPILMTFLIGALVLTFKLAQLQLFSDTYKKLAQKTILDKQVIYPARGLMYDRNGQLLTFNKAIYDLEAIYRNVNPDMDTSLFCSLLDIDRTSFESRLEKDWRNRRFHKSLPFTFMSKIDQEQYARFQEQLFRFPGFYPIVRNIRAYPHSHAAHVLGYLGEVDRSVIESSDKQYEAGDYIGMSGLERFYESRLRGRKGVKFLLRDNVGREVSSFSNGRLDSTAVEGTDIITTLDLDLQAYCEKLMQNKRGSIVAIEPSSGEILAMVSAPCYDPNKLNLDRDRGKAFAELTSDQAQKPLLDRSISARYPPGSIFKPILSLIALQEGLFKEDSYVPCQSYYQYKSFTYGCHDHPPARGIESAIMYSCNSYFFTMIRELIEVEGFNKPGIGLDRLNQYLYSFGLGNKLGVDLTHEEDGFVPTPEYYKYLYRSEGGRWYSTYVMSIGIGQGELELTTLQMANLAAIVANRGFYYTPHLAKEFKDPEMTLDEKFTTVHAVDIDKKHFEPVIEGMHQTIIRGTGYKAYVPGIDICGKTGTSENTQSDGKDHSVFYAFAPKANPKIALAVYVENAGFGGDIAAPIAGFTIEKYLRGETNRKAQEEAIINLNLIDNP